ncbi:MAG TPA: DUF1292 domain-containing protein [Bacilli bacterium]
MHSNQLSKQFGQEIELYDEQDHPVSFRILAEFSYEEEIYAILQSEELKKEDDIEIFQVSRNEQGEIDLNIVEDEDLWENIAEIYDEMVFSGQM